MLHAALAAQGNLKGQGMARRPMPCPFQFSRARQDGARLQFPPMLAKTAPGFNSPVLVRTLADLLVNLGS